ncbi:hypothetical protein L1987_09928 [Smallanthus sonchifolius]|uniref:Uncharacterized protein n=1 Tax=Smallanthus sonchifolius TaxID=185202 RepID=A0ACB9JQN1_9ASTR|nr:hypothetical protein L1987_09928 [Smallanthus sonchifolius]
MKISSSTAVYFKSEEFLNQSLILNRRFSIDAQEGFIYQNRRFKLKPQSEDFLLLGFGGMSNEMYKRRG